VEYQAEAHKLYLMDKYGNQWFRVVPALALA
jgi:hypothetical protein